MDGDEGTPNRSSVAWQFFAKMKHDKARCLLCGKIYQYVSSTTSLLKHVKKAHQKEYNDVTSNNSHVIMTGNVQKQPRIEQFLKYKSDSPRKMELDESLLMFLCGDKFYFDLVDTDAFRTFVNELDNKYFLPTKKEVEDQLIPRKFEEIVTILKNEIEGASSLALTLAVKCLKDNSSALAITGHYYDKDSNAIKTVLLHCSCSEFEDYFTNEGIQKQFLGVINQYSLENKVLSVTTNEEANLVKVVEDLGHFGLRNFAKNLNAIVTDSLRSSSEIMALLDKLYDLSILTEGSDEAKEKFVECQNHLSLTPFKKLLQYDISQFKSIHLMVKRALEVEGAIELYRSKIEIGMKFSVSDWNILRELELLLTPCYEAATEMSDEKNTTSSKILIIVNLLTEWYEDQEKKLSENGSEISKVLCHEIIKLMKTRFQNVENVRELAIAALLDPRFKERSFKNEEAKKSAIAWVQQELRVFNIKQEVPNELFPWLADVKPPTEEYSLRAYLNLPNIPRLDDPFQWWEEYGKLRTFFNLAKIAVKYLVMPATTVACEQVFENAENLVERRQLRDENVNRVLCLNKNWCQNSYE